MNNSELLNFRSKWKPGKEEVVARNGIVTTMYLSTAEAGLEMLKKGGNAVDAAVATAFCNVVVEPYMATLAGWGFMLIHLAKEKKTIGIDFNHRAPRNAKPDMYRLTGVDPDSRVPVFKVENDANHGGPLSAVLPGTCAGLCEAHKRYGRLPREQVMEPAIHLASEGFEASWNHTLFAANWFDRFNRDPYLASILLPNGRVPRSYPKPGERIVQRDLGELLKRIAKDGQDAMYRGEMADAIDEFMRKNGGILTKQDLEEYRPGISEALLSVAFKGYTIKAVPSPHGAITNLETFGVLDNFDLKSLGHNSADYLHLFIQAARHTFADYFRYLGDWEYAPVPLKGLLSREYHKELAQQVNVKKANIGVSDEAPWAYYLDHPIHDPWKYDPSPAPKVDFQPAMGNGEGGTCHFNVVDRDRNAVSCTHSGGCSPGLRIPSTGLYLSGVMYNFVPKPGYANSIAGWKRPMDVLAPLMVFREGRPVLCQGAPGDLFIMNRGVQVINNILVFGMTPQEAVVQPTVDASGRDTLVDSRLPDDVVEKIERFGHRVKIVEEEPGMTGSFSRPSAIQIDYEKGLLRAGVEAFRPTTALGY